MGQINMARAAALLACSVLAAVTSGCVWEPLGPRIIPLTLKDRSNDEAIQEAVVISLVRSTGWFPYIEMESKPHPFDEVRVEAICRLSPSRRTVVMPRHLPASGCMFGLIINEHPEVLVFSRGYKPGGWLTVVLDGTPPGWAYTPSAYRPGAGLVAEMTPLAGAPATSPAAATRPAGACAGGLLTDENFWRGLRDWRGRKRCTAEIALICQCVLESAESYARTYGQKQWTLAEQKTLEWCREMVRTGSEDKRK